MYYLVSKAYTPGVRSRTTGVRLEAYSPEEAIQAYIDKYPRVALNAKRFFVSEINDTEYELKTVTLKTWAPVEYMPL